MRIYGSLLLIPLTLALSGCFNTNTWQETKGNSVTVVEHVLAGWAHGNPDGSHSQGASVPPREPRRRLTIAPDFVIIESYDGYTQLIPMSRLHALSWKPNPDPPQTNQEN